MSVPFWGVTFVCLSSLGLAALNESLGKNPSRQAIHRAVFATYFLIGATAIGTLVAGLPPPAFWVVSAILPAWQTRRLLNRNAYRQAHRMFQMALGVYVWVLAVALWLPILLSYR